MTALLLVQEPVRAYGLGNANNIQHTYQCLHNAAKKHGHRPELLFGIAAQESSFNPKAVSYIKGKPIAYGVMQVYYDVHKPVLDRVGVSREDLFNPCIGADQGGRILREFMQVHGNSWKAVGAYYAGNRFQNEKDRQWYANSVARRVAWFEQYGTASILNAGYSANKHRRSTTGAVGATANVAQNIPSHKFITNGALIAARAATTVAWEAKE